MVSINSAATKQLEYSTVSNCELQPGVKRFDASQNKFGTSSWNIAAMLPYLPQCQKDDAATCSNRTPSSGSFFSRTSFIKQPHRFGQYR